MFRFRVSGFEFRVSGLGFGDGFGSRVSGPGSRVSGFGSHVGPIMPDSERTRVPRALPRPASLIRVREGRGPCDRSAVLPGAGAAHAAVPERAEPEV